MKHWCPELKGVPAEVLVQPGRFDAGVRAKHGITEDVYPRQVVPLKFGGGPAKKGGGGGGGGYGGKGKGRSAGGGGGGDGRKSTAPFKGPRRPQHRLQSAAWDTEG